MMDRALAAYRYGDIWFDIPARTYSQPKATLKRRVGGARINAFGHKQLFGRAVDLPEEAENDLVNNML